MESHEVWITPEEAKKLLAANTDSRRQDPNAAHIRRLVKPMKDGTWNTSIRGSMYIGDDGVIYDGICRLLACVEANASFNAVLTTGPSVG